MSIGSREGDAPGSFAQIGGGFRDGQGRIVALDLQARELRFIAPDGALLHVAGGPGEGPGEFSFFFPQFPAPLYQLRRVMPWQGDSIAVHGMTTGTLQILDAEGMEGRRISDPELRRWPQAAWGADRILLTSSGAPAAGPEVDGWLYDVLLAVGMEGEIEPVGVYPRERVSGAGGGLAAPVRDGFVTAKSHLPELRFHDWDGNLRRVVHLPIEPRAVSDSLQQPTSPTLERLPVVLYVTTDHDGFLWFAGGQRPSEGAADALHVVSPEGRYLGDVALPARFHPLDIGDDWILGIWRDELDVEYLQLYDLDRRNTS